MHPIISVRNLKNQFGDQVVHDDLNLDIYKGEIIGIVGGSGTGKSVLMRTIIKLQERTSGTIEMMGKNIDDSNNNGRLNYGVLFQNGALFSALTVLENIMFPMREHTKLNAHDMEQLARIKISLVGLKQESAHKLPAEISGGMRKRVALARSLAMEPEILFLDEPTAGLDPIGAAAFDNLIKDLRSSLGITCVIITHDLDTLYSICDRIAVLVDKKIVVDTLENLLKNKHPWIKEYFHGERARAITA